MQNLHFPWRYLIAFILLAASHLVYLWPMFGSLQVHPQTALLFLQTWLVGVMPAVFFLRFSACTLFDQVVDLVFYDRPECYLRFFLLYLLRSHTYSASVVLKIQVAEPFPVVSVSGIFSGFSWLEREVFDLLGVFFLAHSDLRRILTDYCFIGHPFRRDFPLAGLLTVMVSHVMASIAYVSFSLLSVAKVLAFTQRSLLANNTLSGGTC